jgi:hypothetical protein
MRMRAPPGPAAGPPAPLPTGGAGDSRPGSAVGRPGYGWVRNPYESGPPRGDPQALRGRRRDVPAAEPGGDENPPGVLTGLRPAQLDLHAARAGAVE